MFITKEEIGSTDLLFLTLCEMPTERDPLFEQICASDRTVLLLPHLSSDGELRLLPKEAGRAYLPEALLLCAKHLLVRRGLPLDELSFVYGNARYRITHANSTIFLTFPIAKGQFTKRTVSLSDCTADVYLTQNDGGHDAVFLCDDLCPLDMELLWRLCRAFTPSLSQVLALSVSDGTLHLCRSDGKTSGGASLCDTLRVLSLCRSLGRRLPELSLAGYDGLCVSLVSTLEGRFRYCYC